MTATAEPTGPENWSRADTLSPADNPATAHRQRVNPPEPDRTPRGKVLAQSMAGGDDPSGPDGAVPAPPLRMAIRTFDRWAERPFAHLRGNKTADRLFYGASEAANFSMLWHAMAWTPVLLRPSPQRLIRAVSTSGSLAMESVLVNGPVKSVFRRTRPVLEQGHLHVHHLRTPRSTSFPSGHASAAVVAVMVMGRDRHPLTRWLLLAAASLVSASRVHVRIHHPSDVVGGAVIGWLLGRFLRRVLP